MRLPRALPFPLPAGLAFAAGYACCLWISGGNGGRADRSPVPAAGPAEAEDEGALSPSELRAAITAQEALVAENRRRLEAVLPDVPALEERLQRTAEAVSRMARPDLPERELMELAAVLGGAAWMPQAAADYRKAQEDYAGLSKSYGSRHPKMMELDGRIAGLTEKITAETGRVFEEQRAFLAVQTGELPALREKAAKARETPELWRPLEEALRASELRLRDLRGRLAVTLIRGRR